MTEHELRGQILAYGVPHELLLAYECEIADAVLDEQHRKLAAIGRLLCDGGREDSWRRIYRTHFEDEIYVIGDELLWLVEHEPRPIP